MASARWIERPEERPDLVLDFVATDLPAPDQPALELQQLTADRGNGPLWKELSTAVTGGERVLVTGDNGLGKSTLLALVAGDLAPASGTIRRHTRIGLLPQLHDGLPLAMRTIDFLRRQIPMYEADAEALLAAYLFDIDDFHRPLGTLSAGELRRLLLACLVNGGYGVLLLDEPTNFLDFESLDVVEAALSTFRGTLIAVSHDQRFADALRPTRRWHLAGKPGATPVWTAEPTGAS